MVIPTRCPYCGSYAIDYLDFDDSFTDEYYARYIEAECEDCGKQFQLEMDFTLVRWVSYDNVEGVDFEDSDRI